MNTIKGKQKRNNGKLKPWTTIHEKKYKWLYNYIKEIYPKANEDDYINTYKRQLLGIIQNNNKWGESSKEGLYFMIARWLERNETSNTRYIKTYQNEGWKLKKHIDNREGKNELDEKEQENFRPRSYFIDILNEIKPNEISNIIDHYKYLLLSLLTKQPPLRTSFYTSAKIIRTKADNDKINNFVLINRRGKIKAYYIVNKDKASNYKLYNMNKNLSTIEMVDDSISQLINDSYIKYPRNYLFEINKNPISQNTLLSWLRAITKVNNINIDMMRASYISWFYENKLKFTDRDALSKQMRHSVSTAMKNYNKVFEKETIDKNHVQKLMDEINKYKYEIQQLKEKLSKYEVKDENEIDDRLFRKRRSDIIYQIRKGKKPKNETLKMYNIKLEDYTN